MCENEVMYDTVSYPLQEESQSQAGPADKGPRWEIKNDAGGSPINRLNQ